jgi:hypothetical protein
VTWTGSRLRNFEEGGQFKFGYRGSSGVEVQDDEAQAAGVRARALLPTSSQQCQLPPVPVAVPVSRRRHRVSASSTPAFFSPALSRPTFESRSHHATQRRKKRKDSRSVGVADFTVGCLCLEDVEELLALSVGRVRELDRASLRDNLLCRVWTHETVEARSLGGRHGLEGEARSATKKRWLTFHHSLTLATSCWKRASSCCSNEATMAI